jgi:hypothetical protein
MLLIRPYRAFAPCFLRPSRRPNRQQIKTRSLVQKQRKETNLPYRQLKIGQGSPGDRHPELHRGASFKHTAMYCRTVD